MQMRVTVSLHSPELVEPPSARTWMAWVVPGVRPVSPGLKAGFNNELHIVVTVRLNVMRQLTQQTIQNVAFLLLDRGYHRTPSCLGLSGNRALQIIHCGLQSGLIEGWCRRDDFIDVNTLDDRAPEAIASGSDNLLTFVFTVTC